jgi:hypothetical protein
MLILRTLGWLSIVTSAGLALRLHWLDTRLQDYRSPDVGRRGYLFVPIRWQRRLYEPEGYPLLAQVRRMASATFGIGILGLFLLAASW